MSSPNPDRERIRAFLAAPDSPLAFDSSPLAAALDAAIIGGGKGRLVLRFRPGSLFLQGGSLVQGGAISAMLDFAMAGAVMTQLPDGANFATASLTVCFLAPVSPGTLIAEGLVERMGRRTAFTRANLRADGDEKLMATATSVLTIIMPATNTTA